MVSSAMKEHDRLSTYRDFISTAYKSLEHPDFSFVKQGFNARPYDPLIKRLRDYAVVEEAIEADDDVCFSYLLKGQSALWKLDLSLVGPFGLFVRLKARVAPDDFLHYTKPDATSFERKVLDLLRGAGIRLLTTEELSLQVPMTLFNTTRESVRLYQALFSDRNALPWVPSQS
jgi:hypothetical protein